MFCKIQSSLKVLADFLWARLTCAGTRCFALTVIRDIWRRRLGRNLRQRLTKIAEGIIERAGQITKRDQYSEWEWEELSQLSRYFVPHEVREPQNPNFRRLQ